MIKTDCYRKPVMVDQVACIIEVLEMSGLEPHQVHRNQVLSDADAFMVVYSTKSRSSLSSIHRLTTQIMGIKRNVSYPVVLIGHDYGVDSRQAEREVSHKEGAGHAQAAHCDFAEASASNYVDVEKTIFDLIRILRRKKNLPPVCCEPCQCEHGARF